MQHDYNILIPLVESYILRLPGERIRNIFAHFQKKKHTDENKHIMN